MWLLAAISILGFGFVSVLPNKNDGLFKILLSPALGLFVFTQLVLILAFIFGVSYSSIFLALLLTAILSILCFFKFKQEFSLKNFSIPFIIITLLITSFLAYIWLTQALAISGEGFKTGGGGMYGDSALHAAYTSRLETGEFPIQNPLFAGSTLVYPLANDLLSATAKIAGLDFNLAFSWPQILFLIGFLTLFYQIIKKFTSDLGFLISILILLLGWGIGVFFFLNEWNISGQPFWQFLTKDYTNNANYNLHFHNILTGLILPERSFLPGLFLGLVMFLSFMEYFRSKNIQFLFINGIILGALPFWHTHTFIFFLIASLIFAVWLMRENFKKTLIDFSLMSIVALVMAIPFLFLFFSNHQVGQFLHTSLGWQNGTENILLFWFKNSLLTIPLALLGFWFVKHDQKIFFVPAFVVFLIANFVIFQPWDWDNIKLLSWSFLFFAILTGVFLSKIFYKGVWGKTFIVIIILISTASGILSVALQLKNKFVIYDKQDIELANWAKVNTDVDKVFIIETNPNHPIPGLAGRLVYMGYPGHLWVHGVDYGKREQQINQILAGDFSPVDLLEVPISYIVLPKNKIYFELQPNLQEVFQNQKYIVLKKTN